MSVLPVNSKTEIRIKSRIGVVETVYYQLPQEQPTSVDTRFFRETESVEQPYTRSLVATEQWSPLVPKGCWVKEVGLMIVKNLEGMKTFQVNPTEEQKREALAKVLELAIGDHSFAVVYTGESIRMQPVNLDWLRVRCMSGSARFSIHLLPG